MLAVAESNLNLTAKLVHLYGPPNARHQRGRAEHSEKSCETFTQYLLQSVVDFKNVFANSAFFASGYFASNWCRLYLRDVR